MCAAQDVIGLLEKRELAQKVQEVILQGQASISVPGGYVKDDTSGIVCMQTHCEWLHIGILSLMQLFIHWCID